jgi:hypothetical protein
MGHGIWDMGYGIWDMGYGIWDMGYGIWDMDINVVVLFFEIRMSNLVTDRTSSYDVALFSSRNALASSLA